MMMAPLWLMASEAEVKPAAETAEAYDERAKAGFSLLYKGKPIPYKIFSLFVMPGDQIRLMLGEDEPNDIYIDSGKLDARLYAGISWLLNAPDEPGLYPVIFNRTLGDNSITINIFVKRPASEMQGEYLNGYRIGKYPVRPLNGNPAYNAPRGFIEVTPENMHTKVSPHFTLGQFLCKQKEDFPKYVVLRERLLIQLEMLLEELHKNGYRAPTFHVMSGYRTPYYNRRIGNSRYSRHIYGDAADIFIDTSRNGWMDDLNGDGVVDRKDARILFNIIDQIQRSSQEPYARGGVGLYGSRPPWRGPFIHVDARGHVARWGI